jgi:outer membrane PBP1 activator LpoA protein
MATAPVTRHLEGVTVLRRTIVTLLVLIAAAAIGHTQSAQPGTQSEKAAAKSPPPAAKDAQASEKESETLNLTAYAELLRSDVRAQKVAIITQVMDFTEAEDAAFWPIYREYDLEMSKLGDERVALIEEYAKNYSNLTDAVAEKLASKALDLESRRQALKAKCFERVKGALSPVKALRFLQVEHQLQLLIDLQISASLPVVKATE